MDSSKFTAHKLSVADAERHFQTSLKRGLSSEEVEKRQKEHGLNELDKEEDKTLWERIMEQFEDTLVQILLAAATVSLAIALLGDGEEGIAAYVEPFVILLILFANGAVAIWQDSNADNALEALKELQAQECMTLRDGQWETIDAVQLVPGDIIRVKQGECVPADARVAEILSISLQLE